LPVGGPIDVLTDPSCGALDEDLGAAVRRALTLSRQDARRFSANFTWSHCADQFLAALVPAREAAIRAA